MNSGNFAEAKIMTRMLFFTHTGPIFRLMSDRLTGVKKRIQGIAIFPVLCNLLLFVFDTRKMRFKSVFFCPIRNYNIKTKQRVIYAS